MKEEALEKRKGMRTVIGTRPVHIHVDPDTNQQWECNSAYCSELSMPHPDNGGPTPVVLGYEPWRR
jgi:hypothetical protein